MKMRKGLTYLAFLVILALSITATCIAAPGVALTTKPIAPAYKMAVTTVPSTSGTTSQAPNEQPPRMMNGARGAMMNVSNPMQALVTLSGKTQVELVAAYPKMNPWQIANKLGILDALKAAVLKDAQTSLAALVASGKITSAVSATKYAQVQKMVGAITAANVDAQPQMPAGGKQGGAKFQQGFAQANPIQLLSTITGKTPQALNTAYPQTTAWQMAQKLGVLDTLKTNFLAASKTSLDTMVTNGKMTSAQETTIYTNLQQQVSKIDGINTVVLGNQRGMGGFRGGRRGGCKKPPAASGSSSSTPSTPSVPSTSSTSSANA